MDVEIVINHEWLKEALRDGGIDAIDATIGEAVLSDAQRHVPVRTGRLKRSLRKEKSDDEIRIGSNEDYALPVEDGTSRMSAQPYLKPALYKARG